MKPIRRVRAGAEDCPKVVGRVHVSVEHVGKQAGVDERRHEIWNPGYRLGGFAAQLYPTGHICSVIRSLTVRA